MWRGEGFLDDCHSCWFLLQSLWALWPWAGAATFQWQDFLFFPFRLSGDDDNELFKRAALKVPRPKAQAEEEDEDEVVRNSQALRGPHSPTWGPSALAQNWRLWVACSLGSVCGACGSRRGAGRGQLCKHSGRGQIPLHSWKRTTIAVPAGRVSTLSEESWAA